MMKPMIELIVLSLGMLVLVDLQGKCNGEGPTMVGGLSAEKPVNTEVSQMMSNLEGPITEAIESQPGGLCLSGDIVAISYKTQIVSGINYFVKVRAPIGRRVVYFLVRIYKSFDGAATLHSVKGPVSSTAGIVYF